MGDVKSNNSRASRFTKTEILSRQGRSVAALNVGKPTGEVMITPDLIAPKDSVSQVSGALHKQTSHNLLGASFIDKVPLKKAEFIALVKNTLAKGMTKMYRHCDTAYAAMDMFGRGYIDVDTFVDSIAVKRMILTFNRGNQD